MTRPLIPGQTFLIPLQDGRALPGYVVHDGHMFTLVNVYRTVQDTLTEPQSFETGEILLRDWLVGDHVFSRSKKIMPTPWKLFSKARYAGAEPPHIDGIIIGSRGTEHVVSIHDQSELRRPPTEEDFAKLPKHRIKVGSYYSLAAEAAFLGKEVYLDPEERIYKIK